MGAVLLDTTIVVDALRGRTRTLARLDGLEPVGDAAYVCAITVEEISRGIRPEEEDAFMDLLEGLRAAPLGIAEGRLAGFWKRTLSRRGRTISQPDALIAAAAVGIGARLATGNPKDFAIPGLVVEHWPAGE